MNDSYLTQDVAVCNQRSLRRIERAISLSQGEFSLILLCCNDLGLRERVMQGVSEAYSYKIQKLVMPPSSKTLYTTIQTGLKVNTPEALVVLGLESVCAIEQVLIATNLARNLFKTFPFPLLLWVNDEIMQKLVRLAPDFKGWAASTIRFGASTDRTESEACEYKSA